MTAYPFDTLSFSSLNGFVGYMSCQMAWKLSRLDNAPPDKPKGQQLVLGTAFDAAAQALHDGTIAGERLAVDEAIGVAIDAWNLEMGTGEYAQDQWSGLPGLLPSAVRQYANDIVPTIQPIETQHKVDLELEGIEWRLTGRIDLLATLANGAETIIETKATAGSTKYDPDEDLQLNLYALARRLEVGTAPEEIAFHTARIQKTQARIEIDATQPTDDSIRRAEMVLVDGATLIEDACSSGRFLPTARLSRSFKCSEKFCEYYPRTCPWGARGRKAPAS